ncbi:SusD/RagB family nutrient-binding outer membrane lipoprotein [Pedobacter frigoris]|uniref:SusD/RagB family nutrient-binding outer membrane lipoprotein n=1 Tax=Pedobacter frigoris TaxID=2571272 RepID=A0A4U1CB46_9SPHI|nr:SusD/RagB family nutrient-binding outer membrane lipoprotein [Pedobacter frigoris]TKC03729.1 SusD/RagB family nutrient-binding outer membrane lipoprotein [Pedobacter frigoris]
MKTTYKVLMGLAVLTCISITSCKKETFVELNTNPEILDKITPEQQFYNVSIRVTDNRSEWYYDNLRGIMPWMQMSTPLAGNGVGFVSESGNLRNVRYGMFYPGIGAALVDIEQMISQMSEEEKAKRVNQVAIAKIVKAYYAFYVSDINGSIAYSEALQGKYGGTFTPKYDTQEQLFDLLDTELKTSISQLSGTPAVPQTLYGASDMFFGGVVSKWVKTANAIRMRMAMRLMKRNPTKMTTRIQEILSTPANLMIENADSWVFEANATFASGGDWSALNLRAPRPVVDFMYTNSDPRIRFFYQQNLFSQANFDAAKAQGKIPATAVFDTKRYYGVATSPDASAAPDFAKFFNSVTITPATGGSLVLDTLSNLQPRLFSAGENGGTGVNFFPLVTYADFCFMRAELAARAITTENAKEWYDKGITASIKMYDDMANRAKIVDRSNNSNYVAATDAEIIAYLAKPAVVYTPAKGIDQIACQAYLHFFKQPSEAWALYKRTGYPNTTSVLPLEKLIAQGTEQTIPRRASLQFPGVTNLNYQNIINAFDEMKKDPDWGTSPSDIFGRVWWDKK